MSKARLVITAVVVENRPVTEVARTYSVARSWVYGEPPRFRTPGPIRSDPEWRMTNAGTAQEV